MGKIIIINPNAKGIRKRFSKRLDFLQKKGFHLIVSNSLNELEEKIEELPYNQLKSVGIFGGDGTIFHTLNVIYKKFDQLPDIFYLPGGTYNTIGKNIGFKGDPFKIADKISNDKFIKKEIPTLKILTPESEFIGFIFTSGLPYRSMEQYYADGEPTFWTGVKTALWPLGSFFFPFLFKNNNYFDPPLMRIEVEGDFLWECPTLTVTCATVKNLGLWISPFSEDGEGFYTLISSVPIKDIMKKFFQVLTGNFSHPRHYNKRSREVKVVLSHGYLIDGEMFPVKGQESLEIRTGPILKFLVPE